MIEFIVPFLRTVHKLLSDWTLSSSDHTTPTELTVLPQGTPNRKHHLQQYPAGLPIRCLTMDGLLLLRARKSRACLPSRCLEMGLCITIYSPDVSTLFLRKAVMPTISYNMTIDLDSGKYNHFV
jgi:hypothetical protein